MENKAKNELNPQEAERNSLRPGIKVHGLLARQVGPTKRNKINTYHGEVTKVSENKFWVKYKGVVSAIPYEYKSLGRIVFIEENTCQERCAEMENPVLEEGIFDAISKAAKKEKTKDA